MNRAVLWFVVCFATMAHTWSVLKLWEATEDRRHGADFASYYYAVKVAADGADPYDTDALEKVSRSEGTRSNVYPYLYPPPFLLGMVWALPLDLYEAYLTWFWIDEAFAVLVAWILWRWWKGMGTPLPLVLLAIYGTWSIFAHNHHMGQVNLPVLAVTLAGLWAAERDREVVGGALIGLACMWKMSPALFVLWWLTHKRYRAAGTAVATGVALSLLSLPLAGPDVQWHFYRDVLPTFGTGEYGGLTVKINLPANHSLPSLYDRLFPGNHKILTPTAQALSTGSALALVGGLLWAFRRRPVDVWTTAGQVSAVCVALLLVPVYTYEHHLVWALPALVTAACAVFAGRLPPWCAIGVAYAWYIFAFDIFELQDLMGAVSRIWTPLATLVRESKLVGLLILGAMAVWLGTGRRVPYTPASSEGAT